jgi:hypothetical protein
MGKHSKPAYELAETDGPGASAIPDVRLSGYRAAVDDLVTEGIRKLGLADPSAAARSSASASATASSRRSCPG